MKKIALAVMLVCLMAGTAFAGVKEMKEAYYNKDYTTCVSESEGVIADATASVADKAAAQCYKGYCYRAWKEHLKAISELQKAIDNYPSEKSHCAHAQLYIGRCYSDLGDTVKAQEAYLKVLTNYPKFTAEVRAAIDKVDFASMSDEEVVTIYNRILRATPATAKNAEFLGRIKSELEKLK